MPPAVHSDEDKKTCDLRICCNSACIVLAIILVWLGARFHAHYEKFGVVEGRCHVYEFDPKYDGCGKAYRIKALAFDATERRVCPGVATTDVPRQGQWLREFKPFQSEVADPNVAALGSGGLTNITLTLHKDYACWNGGWWKIFGSSAENDKPSLGETRDCYINCEKAVWTPIDPNSLEPAALIMLITGVISLTFNCSLYCYWICMAVCTKRKSSASEAELEDTPRFELQGEASV